jgi:hypothetical protein
VSEETETKDRAELSSDEVTVLAVVAAKVDVKLAELASVVVGKPSGLLEAAVVGTVELDDGADGVDDMASCEAADVLEGSGADSADVLRTAQVHAGSPERIT